MREKMKTAFKGLALMMTVLFFFLWATGILSDVHLMLTVSDEESSSLFMEDAPVAPTTK